MTKVTRYRFKLTESQLCVAINILNNYRKYELVWRFYNQ